MQLTRDESEGLKVMVYSWLISSLGQNGNAMVDRKADRRVARKIIERLIGRLIGGLLERL